jgi:hypothetical protein
VDPPTDLGSVDVRSSKITSRRSARQLQTVAARHERDRRGEDQRTRRGHHDDGQRPDRIAT